MPKKEPDLDLDFNLLEADLAGGYRRLTYSRNSNENHKEKTYDLKEIRKALDSLKLDKNEVTSSEKRLREALFLQNADSKFYIDNPEAIHILLMCCKTKLTDDAKTEVPSYKRIDKVYELIKNDLYKFNSRRFRDFEENLNKFPNDGREAFFHFLFSLYDDSNFKDELSFEKCIELDMNLEEIKKDLNFIRSALEKRNFQPNKAAREAQSFQSFDFLLFKAKNFSLLALNILERKFPQMRRATCDSQESSDQEKLFESFEAAQIANIVNKLKDFYLKDPRFFDVSDFNLILLKCFGQKESYSGYRFLDIRKFYAKSRELFDYVRSNKLRVIKLTAKISAGLLAAKFVPAGMLRDLSLLYGTNLSAVMSEKVLGLITHKDPKEQEALNRINSVKSKKCIKELSDSFEAKILKISKDATKNIQNNERSFRTLRSLYKKRQSWDKLNSDDLKILGELYDEFASAYKKIQDLNEEARLTTEYVRISVLLDDNFSYEEYLKNHKDIEFELNALDFVKHFDDENKKLFLRWLRGSDLQPKILGIEKISINNDIRILKYLSDKKQLTSFTSFEALYMAIELKKAESKTDKGESEPYLQSEAFLRAKSSQRGHKR